MSVAHFVYGMRYFLLRVIDQTCFAWHSYRPLAWQRQLVDHRFRAPHGGQVVPFGTDKERQMLANAQALYPDYHMYLGVGSQYSPWYGYTWSHYVKLLVKNSTGERPENKYGGSGGCYGMSFDQFQETEHARAALKKHVCHHRMQLST